MSDSEQTLKLNLREIQKATAKRPVLVVLQGQPLGLTVPLDLDRVIIGRGANADIVLRDEIASRQHAEVFQQEAGDDCSEVYINDLGSTNGTFLNGSKIASQQLLQDGDKINIGNYLFKFALLDEFEAEFQDRLHQMTQRDDLTGLRSRRSLFADLDRLISRSSRLTSPQGVAVLMADLDFFKRVNDSCGHLIGSNTIREAGHIIRDCLGSADLAARYGGEEYLAYLFGDRQHGFEIAEKIRMAVESYPFQSSTTNPELTMNITISLGVALFPEDGLTAVDLIHKADLALYRAKLSGRNRTCAFDEELDKPDAGRNAPDASAIMYGPADAQ